MALKVGIVMGSDSDVPHIEGCMQTLRDLGIPHEVRVLSAHRTPERAHEFAKTAQDQGFGVIIAAAGGAAHLAGAMAASSLLPVIGIPVASSPLAGFDALLATVQMPPGIPVATVAVGSMGARNAAILAGQILALSDPELAQRLRQHRTDMASAVAAKDEKVRKRFTEGQ